MHDPSSLNRLYQIRERLLQKGAPLTDLVSGNGSEHGIAFPASILKEAVAAGLSATKRYQPDPLGQLKARQAVSRYYSGEGLKIPAEQILITPGTSISYWYAFKALTEPGDEILAPVPSYPLFDHIARLSNVTLKPYPLREAKRWKIDFEQMESAITPRTKAIILISPHNPTGAVATAAEIRQLADIAGRHHLAIISDEVFSSFIFKTSEDDFPRTAQTKAPLVITLNGLSKMLALPGMKIGWMGVTGDPALVKKTLQTLDMISDTFLPVNEIAQGAVPILLGKSRPFQKAYHSEMKSRMLTAVKELQGSGAFRLCDPEGGFYVTLRIDGPGADEEGLVCDLLEQHRILIHPGYFYDISGQHLVLSFVSRPALLRKAVKSLIEARSGYVRDA